MTGHLLVPYRNRCDRRINGFKGDLFIVEIEIFDANTCHTQYCHEKFNQKIGSMVKLYSFLKLPLKAVSGRHATISMVLCNFDELLSGEFSLIVLSFW